MHSLFW